MRGPLAYMARNAVAANLCMAVLIIGGLLTAPTITQEVFPEFDLDVVTVTVAYPGASPAEVEQGVVLAVEEAVRGLDGVGEVRSYASEGLALVTIEVRRGADANQVLADVKSAVDRITSFPVDAEEPVAALLTNRNEVLTLVVSGRQSERALRDLAEQVRQDLLALPEITTVELAAVRPFEISIEVSPASLERYGLTLAEVARRVGAAAVDVPAGGVKTRQGEILLRTTERPDTGQAYGDIVLLGAGASAVRLRDVATVRDTFRETDEEASFNGEPAALVKVYRVGDESPTDVSRAARAYADRKNEALPDGVRLTPVADASELYQDRVDLLLHNAYLGLALVVLVLGLFLELRLALWVTLGIPIAFIGSLLFLPAFGVSINMLSLFAFIVVLGVVVDDAIVVGESIFHRRTQGDAPLAAAIRGVGEVAGPVVFSVLTTVAAFVPLLLVPGVSGKFFRVIPIIVITVLLISLFESLFILPAHLGHTKGARARGVIAFIDRWQGRFSDLVERFIRRGYGPALRHVVRSRYLTLAVAIAVLLFTGGWIAGGRISFSFLPRIDSDLIVVTAELPYGVPVAETRAVQRRILAAGRRVLAGAGGAEGLSKGIFAQIGNTGAAGFGMQQPGEPTGSHLAEVVLYLVGSDERQITAGELSRRWRAAVGEIPGVESLTFKFSTGPGAGAPIDFELAHPDPAVLASAAGDLAAALRKFRGVKDVETGFTAGKPQLDLTLKPAARSLGVTAADLARQVRAAYYGVEAVRQQRGREELRVYVRYPRAARHSAASLENFLVQTPGGGRIPLAQAAEIREGRSFTQIKRAAGRRIVDVTADVDEAFANANAVSGEIAAGVLPRLARKYPRLEWGYGGQQQDQAETNAALLRNFLFGLVAIFALLAIPFGSYVQPLIVMTAIPFGFVGAVWGHVMLGYDLSLISMMGFVALSGIVVNDSLVLVHAVNGYRAEERSAVEAVVAGGERRFRPILLTSLTTFFGLAPMIIERSVQARFLIPMAVSLGFGVLFSTLVTLLLVPSLYLVLEDLQRGRRRLAAWVRPRRA